MHHTQSPYRALSELLRDEPAAGLAACHAWPDAPQERAWFAAVLAVPAWTHLEPPALWRFYAVQRVLDRLVCLVAHPKHAPGVRDAFEAWCAALGLHLRTPQMQAAYHPFWHEVYALDDREGETPPAVTQVRWPAVCCGPLLVYRAGVHVVDPQGSLPPGLASDTLHWAAWRTTRPAVDASHGWGGQSQWRTCARLDVVTPLGYAYNAVAAPSTMPPDDAMPDAAYVHAVRHRVLPRAHRNAEPYLDATAVWHAHGAAPVRTTASALPGLAGRVGSGS